MKKLKTVKELRKALGWRQREMADYLEVHQSLISLYENGTPLALWNYQNLKRLAEKSGLKFEVE